MTEEQTIGKYKIIAELGRGGMGVVYKAWEESLQRYVAIKMLGDQLTQDGTVVERFLREARAVADLHHPNIVQVFAVDTYEGRPYFAMEYVEGESLTDLIHTSNRIEPRRAAQILKEAASGLAASHAKDVVHRDIKPDNIMLTKQGGVKVVDFGIAKVDDPDSKLTATGMMVGTPNYISPEVCLGQNVDARSDIFSLGIVFFEMLAGETPFQADSPIAMMTAVVREEIPDITTLNPNVDNRIRQILVQMLQKEPKDRYKNCHEIIEDLTSYLAGQEPAYAVAAATDATVQMNRPVDPLAPTVKRAVPKPPRKTAGTGARRTGQLGWVIGLFLIVGAAAGSWYYTGEPDQPTQALSQTPETVENTKPDVEDFSVAADAIGLEPKIEEKIQIQERPEEQVALQTRIAEPVTEPVITNEATSLSQASAPTQVVLADTTAKPAQPAGPPKLVVIAFGDPAVSTVVESVIEGALLNANYPVMDEQFFSGLNLGFNPDLASVGQAVQENGGDILIIADIQETGTRQLSFYGRTEQQTMANLQVRAMQLSNKRPLGAPWLKSLEYVPLKASETAREVAEPVAQELIERLDRLRD